MLDASTPTGSTGFSLLPEPYIEVRKSLETPLGRITITGSQRATCRVPVQDFRTLGAYAIVLVLHGEGWYEDALGTQLPVEAGDLMLLFPSVPHAYGPRQGNDWIERYIVFEGPVFSLWEEAGLLDARRPVIRLKSVDLWNERFNHLLGGSNCLGKVPTLEEVCRLQEFLAQVVNTGVSPRTATDTQRLWLASACALLDAGVMESRAQDLHAVADDLGLTYDGFRKRFRQMTGMAPGKYREARRIDRACEMLRLGTMTNREIAETLGFCDEFHFSRRFKQLTGQTPRAFRNALPRASRTQHQTGDTAIQV